MTSSNYVYRIGIDIGGTFTDAVLACETNDRLQIAKTRSVPNAPHAGFFTGLDRILANSSATPEQIDVLLHGSTVVTNSILESKGAPTGMITTAGFRHVMAIGRAEIPRAANLFSWIKPPRPIQPRHIFEIGGRIRLDGSEAQPLAEDQVPAIAAAIRSARLDAIAIVLLHSYANPDHERRIGALLSQLLPDLDITLSVDVLPVFREYERMVTTALNAAVRPVAGHYIQRLANGLHQRDIRAPLLLMKSNGGTCTPDDAAARAIHLALSGPAAGTRGAAWIGRMTGFDDMLTIDMGGTSADVALIREAEPVRTSAGRIGVHPLAVPMIDIHTIGAGGGSLATVTDQGAIRVGPESAGADPGPACYNRGGQRPTVSDANMLLGRIPPHLLDGEVPLDRAAAESAIRRAVAEPLEIDVHAAAAGIINLVNANMVGALKVMSVERGLDPRSFALVAFGGAGPVHGADLMRDLGMRNLVVPRYPGILCAIGLLATDLRYDFAVTSLQRDGAHDPDTCNSIFEDLMARAARQLAVDGIPPERRSFTRAFDMRYEKQGVELTVPCPGEIVTGATIARSVAAFHDLHARIYTFANRTTPVEIVNLRLEATGLTRKIRMPEITSASTRRPEPVEERLASLDGAALRATPVYRREALHTDHVVAGPAIIDQFDATTIVLPGQAGRTDRYGNLIITEGAT